jgi:adenylosuccinate lyase
MPHKDAKGGNPIDEEQTVSLAHKLMGVVVTAIANCDMPYARTLYASANSRIDLEDSFKFMDHNLRNLSATLSYIQLKRERSIERVLRSHGVVTSPQVLTYLTTRASNPMPWSQAHNLIGSLADTAWNGGISFADVLLKDNEVSSRIDEKTLREITDPIAYIGQSKEIIRTVAEKYYKKKTL